jgi:hypothetical protein
VESPLTGGLGNQLFQINLQVQLARKYGFNPMYPKNLVANICANFNKKFYMPSRSEKVFLSAEILRNASTSEVESILLESLSKDKDVVLAKSVLGEVLDKYFYQNFSAVFQPLKKFENLVSQHRSNSVALHFRGTDFSSWDSSAIMDLDFYFRAIQNSSLSDGWEGHLFTDDPGHKVVLELLKKFKNVQLKSSKDQYSDFWKISNYAEIIATPSTFVLWAAMLGRPSKIFIDMNWVGKRVAGGEAFWKTVYENRRGLFKEVFLV